MANNINIGELYAELSGNPVPNGIQVVVPSLWGEDKTPSMSINLQKGLFKCHKTGIRGDIFNMVMGSSNLHGHDFIKAKKRLGLDGGHRPANTTPKKDYTPWDYRHVWDYFKQSIMDAYEADNKQMLAILYRYLDPRKEYGYLRDTVKEIITHYNIGWDSITKSLAIPYISGGQVSYIDLIRYSYDKKLITAYPTKYHAGSNKHLKLNQNNERFLYAMDEKRLSKHRIASTLRNTRPRDMLRNKNGKPLLICEGFKDALTAYMHGFDAITAQGGATTLTSYKDNEFLKNNLKNKNIYIVYDCDESGRAGAKALNALIKTQYEANSVNIVDISPVCTLSGEDLTDFFNKYKKNKNDLNKMMGVK
jgi:DNA primase